MNNIFILDKQFEHLFSSKRRLEIDEPCVSETVFFVSVINVSIAYGFVFIVAEYACESVQRFRFSSLLNISFPSCSGDLHVVKG